MIDGTAAGAAGATTLGVGLGTGEEVARLFAFGTGDSCDGAAGGAAVAEVVGVAGVAWFFAAGV